MSAGVSDGSRDPRIDTVRGIACLLLVAYHVVGSDNQSGMRVIDDSGFRRFSDALAYVRMPLFAVLAGVIYATKPVSSGSYRRFLKSKALRLLVPLIFVGLPFAVLQRIIPGANSYIELNSVPAILIFPYAHFWFLQALFVVFLVITSAEVGAAVKAAVEVTGRLEVV